MQRRVAGWSTLNATGRWPIDVAWTPDLRCLHNRVFHLCNRRDVQVFSPFRDLAGGHRESRRRAEGCIGRGGIALCGYFLSLVDVPVATASGGSRADDDAERLCHTRGFLAAGS